MILAVFDFDGTLASTKDKPQTNKEAREAGWNGKDWWGSPCSLKGIMLHDNVAQAFEDARNDPLARTAIITGRRGIIASHIRFFLRKKGLVGNRIVPKSNKIALKHFHEAFDPEAKHEEYYTGDFVTEDDYPKGKKGRPIDSTIVHKEFIITQRLMSKEISEVHLWDDRKDHVQKFLSLAEGLMQQWEGLTKAVYHRVFPQPDVVNPYIVDHGFERVDGGIKRYSETCQYVC